MNAVNMHTPGPWRAASDGFPSVEAGGAPHLALCNDASIPMAERRANSRLIAAAPDSHEANRLSFVVLCAVRAAGVFAHDTNLRKEVDTAIEANRTAIAKATGASA